MNRRTTLITILLVALAAMGAALWLGVEDETALRLTRPAPLPTVQVGAVNPQNVSASTYLEKPRYGGEDDSGQRWHLTADRAHQTGTLASSTFVLSNLAANWQTAAAENFVITATQGEYEPATQSLNLTGTISATGGGMEILTPAATANLKTRNVSGTAGVQLNGKMGSQPAVLNAQGFNLDAASQRLSFHGRVKLVLQGE